MLRKSITDLVQADELPFAIAQRRNKTLQHRCQDRICQRFRGDLVQFRALGRDALRPAVSYHGAAGIC